jgi:hypothetical protein
MNAWAQPNVRYGSKADHKPQMIDVRSSLNSVDLRPVREKVGRPLFISTAPGIEFLQQLAHPAYGAGKRIRCPRIGVAGDPRSRARW